MKILTIYLIIINAAGLIIMLVDKQKAIRHRWRIPESTLLGVAAAGGSLGSLLGMLFFRHKTRHPKFTITIPLLLAIQAVLVWWLAQVLK